ncbi:hypothetical protein [Phreatobacter sp.]|uniref:hypothetical protein n=1 Tax=Phreatobacter sp. TaxID=1966341 RepID=UPI003F6F76E6
MKPANDNKPFDAKRFDTVAEAAIERAIEASVALLVRHGATDDEIATHIASERQRYAVWKADTLEQWTRAAMLPAKEWAALPSTQLQ